MEGCEAGGNYTHQIENSGYKEDETYLNERKEAFSPI